MIKAIVISTFVHGASTYRPGDQAEFSPPVFASLAGHGLVGEAPAPHAKQVAPAQRTRAASTPSNKKAPEPTNKAATAADAAPPVADSSASQTAETAAASTAAPADTAGNTNAAPDA